MPEQSSASAKISGLGLRIATWNDSTTSSKSVGSTMRRQCSSHAGTMFESNPTNTPLARSATSRSSQAWLVSRPSNHESAIVTGASARPSSSAISRSHCCSLTSGVSSGSMTSSVPYRAVTAAAATATAAGSSRCLRQKAIMVWAIGGVSTPPKSVHTARTVIGFLLTCAAAVAP